MKASLLLIAVLGLLASPALARHWTSRTGGFSVEAEFVELKDGNVVLKQNDGKLLIAPLDKLCPADVEYVNAQLQSADMGMGSTPGAKKPPVAKAGETPCPPPGRLPDGAQQPINALGLPANAAKRLDVDINATLADLGSADSDRIRRRLKLLAETSPAEPNPNVAKILESLLVDSDSVSMAIRTDAARAMKTWSTPENVPALVTVLTGDKSSVIRVAVIEALTRHKPASAIGPLAQQLSDPSARSVAGRALKTIGPAAEDAVLKRMEGEDAWTRIEVCEILGAIGTRKSIPALEKATEDPSWLVTKPAEKALEAIKLRERTKPN